MTGKIRLLMLLAVCMFTELLAASVDNDVFVITDEVRHAQLGTWLDILEDESGELTIDDLQKPELAGRFSRSSQAEPGFGFSDSVFWARFTIDNPSQQPLDWYLELGYALIDWVDLYVPDGGGGYSQQTYGDMQAFANRPLDYRNIVFLLREPANSSRTYFVRFDSSSSMNLTLNFWRPEQFLESSNTKLVMLGIYYGALLIMVIYNLLHFVMLRERDYLYYVLFFTSFGFFQLSINGMAFQYFWPDAIWWAKHCIPFFLFVTLFSLNVWARTNLGSFGGKMLLEPLFRAAQVVNIIGVLLIFIAPYALIMKAGTFIAALTTSTWLLLSMVRSKQGQRTARFFLVAMGLFFIGALLFIGKTLGYLPGNPVTDWGMHLGAFAALILFSFSTTDQLLQALKHTEVRLESQVRERTRELEIEKRKLQDASQAKSEFLSYMSHEIRTPLNGILGMARLLKDSELDKDQGKLAQTVCDSGDALVKIVNDLLDVSKLEAGQLKLEYLPFRVADVSAAVVSVMLPLAHEKQIKLESQLDSALPEALIGDPFRLHQVLMNLVSNAIKFTNQGGVDVQLQRVGGDDESTKIEFSVTDTGVGISSQEQDKLFQPYSQATAEVARLHGGTGLGLVICRQLVQLMGGQIKLASKPGEGSSFRFQLSLETGNVESIQEKGARSTKPLPLLPSLKVLQVEDNVTNQDVIERTLRKYGHKVVSVLNGREAIDLIETGKHSFDVIITDRHMPELDGLETARRIRQMDAPWDSIPILGITASVVENEMKQCLDAGMNHVLAKPVDEYDLLESLANLVGVKPAQSSTKELPVPSKLPVMVVDDVPTNLKLASIQLEMMGVSFELFQQAPEALEKAKIGGFSVILLDIRMPVLGGVEFARQLRAWEKDHGGQTIIIAVSGDAAPEDQRLYRSVGMDDCVEKPVTREQLRKALAPWVLMETAESSAMQKQPETERSGDATEQAAIDLALLAEILGTDDVATHEEMIAQFIEHFPPLLAKLKSAADGGDEENVRDAAHAAKSAASSAAAIPLKVLLEKLQKTSATASAREIGGSLKKIETEFQRLLKSIPIRLD